MPVLVPVRNPRIAAQLNLHRGVRALLVEDESAEIPESKLIHPQEDYVEEMKLSKDERSALYHAFSTGLLGNSELDDAFPADDEEDETHFDDFLMSDVVMVRMYFIQLYPQVIGLMLE